MEITSGRMLTPAALTRAFNAGFAEYVVPLEMSEAAFAEHVEVNDIDLDCSRFATDVSGPLAFALIGRRDRAAWVGGMGTVPSHRARGLGEQVLRAALEAAAQDGARTVWLEVIDRNRPAIALYSKLGFEPVRDLVVWSLPARRDDRVVPPGVSPADAHAWIAAHRRDREPWQRGDAVVTRHLAGGADLRGHVTVRDGTPVAAALVRAQGDTAAILQIAAVDAAAAADVLGAAVAGHEELRLSNVPLEGVISDALGALGARQLVRQHELRLAI